MAARRKFVENAYYYNSINAAVQRNSPYGPNDSRETKATFRGEFRRQLTKLVDPFLSRSGNKPVVMPVYRIMKRSNDEAAFLSAVHQLRHVMNAVAQSHGSSGQFRVSHAQKGLALLLKYYWCAGETKGPPPFCPLDRRMLWKGGIHENWTQLDDMNEYARWLRQLATVAIAAGYPSLAEWELDTYS